MSHIPGHIATGESATGDVSLGTSAIGSNLFNPDGTFAGQLIEIEGNLFLSAGQQSGQLPRPFTGGNFVLDAGGGDFFQLALNSEGGVIKSGTLTPPTGGGSAPAFSGTEAGVRLAAKLREDADVAQRAFLAEQEDLDRELQLRESRLATARDLVNIRSTEAREARAQGTQLAGEDPFRFLAVARGLQPPTGTTPAAGFKQNLLGAAQFQAPELAGLDSNALESVIGKLSQSAAPQGSATLGFAHGGIVSPTGGATPTGGSQAITVGEAGPEIAILRPDGSVEFVPMAGSAQEGGVFDLGGLAPLFERLRESIGVPGAASFAPSGVDAVNQFRGQFGFLPRYAQQETSAPFQAFAGPVSNIFQGLLEANRFQGVSNPGPEAKRISDLIGRLPAPFKIPPTFFQSLFPAEQNALISAYRFAGIAEADFRHLLTAPQLSATPQRATAVG